jgi:hypothetical protein
MIKFFLLILIIDKIYLSLIIKYNKINKTLLIYLIINPINYTINQFIEYKLKILNY